MKRKQKQKKENSERWLLTYSDLITLLMILFILLFAMSNVSQSKYEELSASLKASMGQGPDVFDGTGNVLPESGGDSVIDLEGTKEETNTSSSPSVTRAPEASVTPQAPDHSSVGKDDVVGSITTKKDMENFEKYLNEILDEMGIGSEAGTSIVDSGLVITFKNDIFFDSGKDELKDEMKLGLSKLAKLLNKIDNSIIIEGHTDNVPISNNSKYNSNWQLSAGRAANVAQYLVEEEKVNGARVSAVGYGEYRPVTSNATKNGRSQNRRVDIIILYDQEKFNIK